MMFLDCPAYLDQDGASRCGLPAEVSRRFIMHSTDGPLESAVIRCPAGHWFNGPIEFLTWDRTSKRDPGAAAVASGARRDSQASRHDRLDRSGGTAVRETPAEPEPWLQRMASAIPARRPPLPSALILMPCPACQARQDARQCRYRRGDHHEQAGPGGLVPAWMRAARRPGPRAPEARPGPAAPAGFPAAVR